MQRLGFTVPPTAAPGPAANQALQVIEKASCGTRGVIVTQDMSVEEAAAMPLAAIPQHMEVTDSMAKDVLLSVLPNNR